MRWLALGILMSVVCVASFAHASTGSPGPATKRDTTEASPKAVGARKSQPIRATKASPNHSATLTLDEPVQPETATSSTVETIKSLANGDSLVNPWMPGRGAIGVNVKVTW